MAYATGSNGIQLELSQKEAFYLYHTLSHIGGTPEGPRGHIGNILVALKPVLDEDLEYPAPIFKAIRPNSLYIEIRLDSL